MCSDDDTHRWVGCPIRISTDQSLLAAPHGFSQRATSFIASWCQGIHRMPFSRSTRATPAGDATTSCTGTSHTRAGSRRHGVTTPHTTHTHAERDTRAVGSDRRHGTPSAPEPMQLPTNNAPPAGHNRQATRHDEPHPRARPPISETSATTTPKPQPKARAWRRSGSNR